MYFVYFPSEWLTTKTSPYVGNVFEKLRFWYMLSVWSFKTGFLKRQIPLLKSS